MKYSPPAQYQLWNHKVLGQHTFMLQENDRFKQLAQQETRCIVCHKTHAELTRLSFIQRIVLWLYNRFFI